MTHSLQEVAAAQGEWGGDGLADVGWKPPRGRCVCAGRGVGGKCGRS